MNNTLYLLDVSPFVHAGRVNKYAFFERLVENAHAWETMYTPAGGISQIFNVLYDIVGRGDIIACCDRNPTVKKEMIPGYKSNRHHEHEVEVNKQVAEYILEKCNVLTVAFDGYEADDIIYTYVQKLHDLYDRIVIYTGDSDLYFLVDEKVEILPTSSRAKIVNIHNYEDITLKGQHYKYNTITLDKILCGDTSDCIPGLSADGISKAKEIFIQKGGELDMMGNRQFLELLAEGVPEILEQINKVFPIYLPDVPMDITTPDKELIKNWGATMHNKHFKGMCSSDFDAELEIKTMQDMGMYIEGAKV